MKKLLYISIGLILGASTLAYAAVPPFQSSQVGSNPQNGYVLGTNGSISTWQAAGGVTPASAPIKVPDILMFN